GFAGRLRRYGKRTLILSGAVALFGIAGLMCWESWWNANPEVGVGLFIGVAATCLYLSLLFQRLEQQAATDPLTGVGNRASFERAIERVLAIQSVKSGNTALFLIDLDGFKQVNDAYGHAVGDELLQLFAKKLRANLRQGDTVARLGGDEFVVLARHVDGRTGARTIANSIHAILANIHTIDGHRIDVSASIGVCMLSVGTESTASDIRVLMRCADSAMYRAKRHSNGQTVFAD
ncbi:diguanylate cyclase, partial [Burkholderia sp. lig30]|uniref:GGDEF domain-containing protein n=1 Tax=Burkholderia sp. lig30 TaxID=1192124 RepID=UPI0004614CFA